MFYCYYIIIIMFDRFMMYNDVIKNYRMANMQNFADLMRSIFCYSILITTNNQSEVKIELLNEQLNTSYH